MSKVTGTDNIYSVTISSWQYYTDFYFVNGDAVSWVSKTSGSCMNDSNHDSRYTAFTTPMSFTFANNTSYFFIGQSDTVGTTSSPNVVACYGASGGSGTKTASDYTTYQKSVSVANVGNGVVKATYTNDSGTSVDIAEGGSATILIGKTITVTETPNAGYSAGNATVTYAGNASSVTVASGGSTFTSGNTATTVTGSFTANTYIVTLNANGGSGGTASVTATYGSAMPSATMPTYTGYTFSGYYDTSATSGGTQYYTAAGASARTWNKTSNTTLYARWSANSYSITYKDEGDETFSGTHGSGYPTTHTYGTATSLVSPTKTGYDFGGWFTSSDCSGTAVTSLGATAYTSAITLYAKWTIKTYTITLSEPGVTGGALQVDGSTFTSGSTVTHGSHTFRVDAPSGYDIDTISGISASDWVNYDSYATLGSTSITEAKTITVTYKVSTNPALRVDYTGAAGTTFAVSGTVKTTNQTNVTVSFTNQNAFDSGTNYSVKYTKDGGSETTLKSGTTTSSTASITAKTAGKLESGTYVYTLTVGTKSSTVTVEVLSAYSLTVAAAGSNSSISSAVADSYYTNVFNETVTAIASAGTYYCKPSTAYAVKYIISDSARYTFASNQTTSTTTSTKSGTVSANTSVTAPTVYTRLYAVTVPSNAAYTISGITTGNYAYGTSTNFTVTPNTGYAVSSVSGTGVTSNGGTSYTINVTAATSISVTSSVITPAYTVSGGTLSGGSYYFDSTGTVTGTITNYSSYPSGTVFKLNGTTLTVNSSGVFTYAASNLTTSATNYTLTATISGTASSASSAVSMLKVTMVNLTLASFSHGDVTVTYKNAAGVDTNLTSASTVRAKSGTTVTITASNFDTDYEFKSVTDGTTTKTTNPAQYTISANTTYTVTIGEIDYVYFYAGLPTDWGSYNVPYPKVGDVVPTTVSTFSSVTLYTAKGSSTVQTSAWNSSCKTFNVKLYKISKNDASGNITVYNSSSYGYGLDCGTFSTTDGYLYLVYTKAGDNQGNGALVREPQTVSISSLSGANKIGEYNSLNIYNSTDSITVNVPNTTFYGGSTAQKTAGGDSVKLTYEVYKDNGSSDDTLVYSLGDQSYAATKSISFANVKAGTGFVNGGEYYIKVTTADSTSGKIVKTSDESTHFYIEDQFTVTVSGTKTDESTSLAKATPTFTVGTSSVNNNGTFSAGTLNTKTVVAPDLSSSGYQFEGWAVTGGVTVSTNSNRTTVVSATAAGTLKALYSLIEYDVESGGKNSTNASNTFTFNGDTATIQLTVENTLTLAASAAAAQGYEFDHFELKNSSDATISGYGNLSAGTIDMLAQDIKVYAVFKAKTPVMSSITSSAGEVSSYNITGIYAGQAITITPAVTAASTGTISYAYSELTTTSGSGTATVSYNSSNKRFTFTAPINIGTSKSAASSFTFKITPTNTPETGMSASGTAVTVTVNVSYSAVQQAYIDLRDQYDAYNAIGINESDIESGWSDFDDYMDAANSQLTGMPAYNATDNYTALLNNLNTAYNNLVFKENTIYVLSKYEHSSSSYVNIFMFNDSTENHYPTNIFYTDTSLTTINSTARNYHMTYEGQTHSGKHLYSFKYRGHQEFIIYRRSQSTYVLENDSNKLTGDVDMRSTDDYDYDEYYFDVKDEDVGVTSVTAPTGKFADLGYTANTLSGNDDLLAQNTEYTASAVKNKLITATGSLAATSSQQTTTTFTIVGPDSSTFYLSDNATDLADTTNYPDAESSWTPTVPGDYTFTLNTLSVGTAETGATATFRQEPTENNTFTLCVAFDKINIYADMNGNIGTPTIHFEYEGEDYATTGEYSDLPYEFDMVTGSESIYSYTISVSTLKESYGLDLVGSGSIEISKISIDSVDIANSTFTIDSRAARTGTLWLKADSTHMKTFDKIAYGSSTRTFKAVTRVSGTDTAFNNSFAEVSGTGIINDELNSSTGSYNYSVFYAAKDTTANYNFSYNLYVNALTDVTYNSAGYYFDHWEKNGATVTDVANGTDISLNTAPIYGTDNNVTYVAVYLPTSSQKRVEITYKFKDFNTDDGNYVYDPEKTLKDASYTKTVKWDGTTALKTLAKNNCPKIMSNYFDYSFDDSAQITTTAAEDSVTKKTCISATLTQTPHRYKIVVVHSNGTTTTAKTGYYQQDLKLEASDYGITSGNYHWCIYEGDDSDDNNKRVLAANEDYTAKYVTYENVSTSVQTIYLKSGTATVNTTPNSAIMYSFSEVYYKNDTPKVRHNFYIIDSLTSSSGTMVGAGVVYATTDSSTGIYRQDNAKTVLTANNTDGKITEYINGILNGTYDLEYEAKSINNIGFRYLPYEGNESVIRYSDAIKAYQYTFAGENTNSSSLSGQNLRVFSFFVYKSGNTYTTVVSGMYAEVSRYKDTSVSSS